MTFDLAYRLMAASRESQLSSSASKKWQQPGWRIEQRYSQGVLVGNWAEDRYKVFNTHTERERERDLKVYYIYIYIYML